MCGMLITMRQRAILRNMGDERNGLVVKIIEDSSKYCRVESPNFKGVVSKGQITYLIDGVNYQAAKRKDK